MRWVRVVGLSTAAACALACGRPSPAPAPGRSAGGSARIASFEGEFDPATRRLSIRTGPATAAPAGLLPYPILEDDQPGSGPPDSIELVTEEAPEPGPHSGGCGTVDSFEAAITIRSFFRDQTLADVYVELTSVTPTTFFGCDSDPAVTGVGDTWGLWDYGALGPAGSAAPPDHATRTWKFRFAESQRFTFQGRVMANLAAPVRRKGPELDWSPSAIVVPPTSFAISPLHTAARVAWGGTAWVDAAGALSFTATGQPADTPVGLWAPARHRVGPFGAGAFFTAADAVGTSGDFTVCVLFAPGAHPGAGPDKVLFAKGSTATGEGWALLQRGRTSCFEYAVGGTRTAACAPPDPAPTAPETWTYDYVCGGRLGGEIRAAAHGRAESDPVAVTGSFGSALALALGAYPDGGAPAGDAALYQVILDRRGASPDVMGEIVGDAEGRRLFPGNGAYAPLYLAPFSAGTSVTGADGGAWVAPPYATVPLAGDGTGLLQAGATVEYTHPLGRDTGASGFCVGAELVATGAWGDVSGGILEIGGGLVSLGTRPFSLDSGLTSLRDDWSVEAGWDPASAHTFVACVEPPGFGTPRAHLYLDGVEVASAAETGTVPSLADPSAGLVIGARGAPPAPLAGARLRRVFAYPSPTPIPMAAPFPTPRVAHAYVAMTASGATATVSVTGLGRAIVRWSRGGDSGPNDGNAQDGYDTRLAPRGIGASVVNNLPADYVIEASAGGAWTTLATVTGNTYITRAHVLDLTGFTSVRMRLTADPLEPGSSVLKTDLDVHEARSGIDDWWLALGDSLTADVWNVADSLKYGYRIHRRAPNRFPVACEGGVSQAYMADFLWTGWTDATLNPARTKPIFQQWVQDFEGRYVVIAIGQNDCNAGTALATMEASMRQMIQIVLDEGKIPVVPTLRWTYTNGAATERNIEAWNARLATVLLDYPGCLAGPDVYTRSKVQGLDGLRSDDTHLDADGVALTQEDWDLWAMATLY